MTTASPSRRRPPWLHLAPLVVLLGLAASCGPGWRVLRQAEPNPFVAHPVFAVSGVSFDGLMIDSRDPIPEAVYLLRKSPEQQAAWAQDKVNLAGELVDSALRHGHGVSFVSPAEGPAAGAFAVLVRVTMIEPGSYFRPPEARAVAQITTPQGVVLDEVTLRVQPNMGVIFPVSAKLRRMGEMLGGQLADYLRVRSGR